jgi:hypothetical protein
MKKVRFIFGAFLLLLTLPLLANEALIEKKKVQLSIALPLLESIEQHAITVGNGPIHMYVFIDPVCPRSRDFVGMIFENEKMLERYTYHFFNYELERFHSKAYIAKIYSEKDPLEMLRKFMYYKEKIAPLASCPPELQKKIEQISAVAAKLEVNKRPYLFVVKPQKGGN